MRSFLMMEMLLMGWLMKIRVEMNVKEFLLSVSFYNFH
jgi:hypothetical protein